MSAPHAPRARRPQRGAAAPAAGRQRLRGGRARQGAPRASLLPFALLLPRRAGAGRAFAGALAQRLFPARRSGGRRGRRRRDGDRGLRHRADQRSDDRQRQPLPRRGRPARRTGSKCATPRTRRWTCGAGRWRAAPTENRLYRLPRASAGAGRVRAGVRRSRLRGRRGRLPRALLPQGGGRRADAVQPRGRGRGGHQHTRAGARTPSTAAWTGAGRCPPSIRRAWRTPRRATTR